MAATFATLWGCGAVTPGFMQMKTEVKVTVEVKVAQCLWAIAITFCLLI
jgi:hypothetical protein